MLPDMHMLWFYILPVSRRKAVVAIHGPDIGQVSYSPPMKRAHCEWFVQGLTADGLQVDGVKQCFP